MQAARPGPLCSLLLAASLLSAVPVRADSPLNLDGFRGQVVYLDFWASWCTPCRQSFPWMQAMESRYASQGLTVIAINLDHSRADAERFLQHFRPDFSVRFDPQGALAENFKVAGMPTSLIIDRHGALRFEHIGFRPADRVTYEHELQAVLAEK